MAQDPGNTPQNDPTAGDPQGGQSPQGGTPPAPSDPQATPQVDVQAELQKALQAQQAEFAKQLKEATGFDSLQAFKEHQLKEQGKLQELLQAKEQEAAQFRQRFEQMAVRAQITQAAAEAVDPEVVLALLKDKAQVGEDGSVSIDGRPAHEAVKALLSEKPYLARPSGNQGSGSPQNPSGGRQLPRAQFNALSPKDQLAFVQAGGVVTD